MAQLSVAIGTARAYLNDVVKAMYPTDTPLITFAQEACRELQAMLWDASSPVVREQSAPILVAANATTLTAPTDMLAPFRLVEFASTGETLANATEMTECVFLPLLAGSAKLIYWSWSQETVNFLGSTADRNVVVYYRRSIPIPTDSTDPIGILFGELYVGARVAAMAHGSLGNKVQYDVLTAVCAANFQKVVAAQRGSQSSPVAP